jgi:hypothetical protein
MREDKEKRIQNLQATEPGKTLKRQVQELLWKMKASASWKSLAVPNESAFSIGIDIGDKKSRYCVLDAQGEILAA